MSDLYTAMNEKFEEWGQDSQALMKGGNHLLLEYEHEDKVNEMLFILTDNDSMVQELLQL